MGCSHFQTILFLTFIFIFLYRYQVQAATQVFNVLQYSASSDGKRDNSKVFSDVWKQACEFSGNSVILIPTGTYLLRPIIFVGPCKEAIAFQVKGTLSAATDRASSINVDHWITFQYIDRLTINGGGTFDGQGASAWPYNTCLKDPSCPPLPISIRFDFMTNSWISNITSINSKNSHFNIFASSGIGIENITISAPTDSPNTDGIHIADSSGILISDCNIGTGDDCVSMGPGSNNINITNVNCGPGHGFSIGSIGGSSNDKDVTNIAVTNCSLTATLSGLRIKTWALPYPSTVSNIYFDNINVNNVNNPILIDQKYCPSHKCNPKGNSMVQIKDVNFRNIWGSSSSKIAVSLQCSRSRPCEMIELRDINLDYQGGAEASSSSCSNVKGAAFGRQNPPSCISRN